ncbi:hypothetical protein M8998_10740 [Sphingobacterium sp. lm-10]|uniref:hypothetical protein n=1 Tax=Sphingobacterium sp. lm-10 TaxID=2944904 RepID=UPI002020DC40|nr:hypothetical protein [Sphingobacterium sp. lm-10]MCL7988416.1 hypothetical protein [Sphingobacterium sp. lm-10]
MIGFLGVFMMIFNTIRNERLTMTSGIVGSIAFSFLFSLVCFIAADINSTNDYAYASYIVSMSLWLLGAYGLCALYRVLHGEVSFRVVTFYLAAVCAGQCIIALMIDNIPSVQLFVDSFVVQGQEFFEDVDRLYGIGAALDPAGVRFSVVLILIAAVLNHDIDTRKNNFYILFLLLTFFIITVVGNIISRTTILGLACAGLYFMLSSGVFRTLITQDAIKLATLFALFLTFAVVISVYLYETNEAFYKYIRFAFEGFFNFVEKGEWRTDSTDKLNREMWIWPTDFKTWIIGSGLFDNFVYNTDIGYCRFILYCGLIGFGIFAAFFVYLPMYFARANPQYTFMFLLLMALSFMIWVKVATDIFQFYALFFCLDKFANDRIPNQNRSYENRVLRPRYI